MKRLTYKDIVSHAAMAGVGYGMYDERFTFDMHDKPMNAEARAVVRRTPTG
jgi:hypothetical protein